ncbi:hypothetical protein LEP1GSC168_0864 [Leptospira santarosai str. HAI134]|nr:hypothetical protein LEP1GSC168_0864 [Leptospira santarosai str. HAI134]
MFLTPQRNLPEKINRTIAFLLSAFFLCVYFWNPISNRVFSLFHVSSPIEIPNFVAFGSARFIEMHGSISIELGRTSIFVCLLLISTIFSYSLWALIHECVHGTILATKTIL